MNSDHLYGVVHTPTDIIVLMPGEWLWDKVNPFAETETPILVHDYRRGFNKPYRWFW